MLHVANTKYIYSSLHKEKIKGMVALNVMLNKMGYHKYE